MPNPFQGRDKLLAQLAPGRTDGDNALEQLVELVGIVRGDGIVELAPHAAIDAGERLGDIAAILVIEPDVESDQDRAGAVRGFGRRRLEAR